MVIKGEGGFNVEALHQSKTSTISKKTGFAKVKYPAELSEFALPHLQLLRFLTR